MVFGCDTLNGVDPFLNGRNLWWSSSLSYCKGRSWNRGRQIVEFGRQGGFILLRLTQPIFRLGRIELGRFLQFTVSCGCAKFCLLLWSLLGG